MLIRRLLLIILGNAVVSQFLGPDIVNYILGDSVFSHVVAAVLTGALLLWSARDKILIRLRLKEAIAAPPRTSIQTVKAEVAAMPLSDKLAQAFTDERKRG